MPITLSVTLTPEQQAWLQAHVAAGDFASLEEGANRRIAERTAEEEEDRSEREASWAEEFSDDELAAIAAAEAELR